MFFNSFAFIGFFIAVLLLLFVGRLFGKNVIVRNVTLLAVSYFFYGYFNVGFTLILLFVTLVNYVAGAMLMSGAKRRKTIVAVCVALSLLPLAFYKYALFLLKSFSTMLSLELNFHLLESLMLPVGISFFTFQALSYTIDIYRGKIKEKATLLDFALFVSFFPTILSGPIEKARNLLPQIRSYFFPSFEEIMQGFAIFIWGMFKKIVVADRLAYYVDWAYGSAEYVSGSTLACAAIFYSIQIYCDFSGYSDMALGVAKALGFDITKNFRQPYFSRTFKDFWRKWHISLTSWFTEYVYFSLGGNRVKHKIRWIFNISMIFILSGIWHGAAWNFLVWGLLHALYYLCEHFLGLQKKDIRWTAMSSFFSGVIVFALVTIAWVFFRLNTFDEAVYVLQKIVTDGTGHFSMGASTFTFVSTVSMLLVFVFYELAIRWGFICFDVAGYELKLIRNSGLIVPLLILLGMFGVSSNSFVYFQF